MADRTISRRRNAHSAVPTDAAHEGDAVTPLRRVVELVRPQANADTVRLLQQLLLQAETGALAGLVAVALLSPGKSNGKKYDFSRTGLAATNPTYAVGAMDVCHMLMQEAALEDSGI